MIHIEIKTDNAAFAGDPGVELARILNDLADRMREGTFEPGDTKFSELPLMDYNGNRVGYVWESAE